MITTKPSPNTYPDNRDVTDGTPIEIHFQTSDLIASDPDWVLSLYVDNVSPQWTTAFLGTLTFTEDAPLGAGSKTVVATDAQVQTTDETHYDDIPLPESYYSIEKVNAGDPDLPTWLKWNAKTGEIYTDQVLTNADALGTWNLNLVFYDGHGRCSDHYRKCGGCTQLGGRRYQRLWEYARSARGRQTRIHTK